MLCHYSCSPHLCRAKQVTSGNITRVTNSSAGADATEAGEGGREVRGSPRPPPPSRSPGLALPTGMQLNCAGCFPPAPGKACTHQTHRCHPNAVPYTSTPPWLRGLPSGAEPSLQMHGSNPGGCHRVRAGVPASRCSPGQPRAGAGGIFPVRVSSRAHGQVLYLKLRQTMARGCPPSHGVSTLQSPSHGYCLLPLLFWGHKKK